MKHLILVTSPPASGKTHVSKQLAKRLGNIVYLDKDALIPLSNRVFIVAGEEINRSSDFFEQNSVYSKYGKFFSSNILKAVLPTSPVAPAMANLYFLSI